MMSSYRVVMAALRGSTVGLTSSAEPRVAAPTDALRTKGP